MKKFKFLILAITLSLSVTNSTNIYSQDDSTVKVEESKVVDVGKDLKVDPLTDSVKVVFSAPEKVDSTKPLILPTLNSELGWLEQSVILVKFALENWRSLGGLGILSLVLLLLITLLNAKFTDGWFGKKSRLVKRLLITVLGQVAGVVVAVWGGAVWYVAIVTGLFTAGGAVVMFEAAKAFFPKKEKDGLTI